MTVTHGHSKGLRFYLDFNAQGMIKQNKNHKFGKLVIAIYNLDEPPNSQTV